VSRLCYTLRCYVEVYQHYTSFINVHFIYICTRYVTFPVVTSISCMWDIHNNTSKTHSNILSLQCVYDLHTFILHVICMLLV